jgi:putative MATE family efflux protein
MKKAVPVERPETFSARSRIVLALGLPIVGGMVSQNVLNWVDTAMVGSLGNAALAAVGAGGFANFMAVAFVTGLSSGVQAMAARRYGEERMEVLAVPLNGGLVLALGLSLIFATFAWAIAPYAFPVLIGDADVVEVGVPYLRARLVGMAFIGMNFAFRGYFNGINESWRYLMTLVVMHAANIFLNWVFIFGKLGAPELGAVGAGVASTVATGIGCAFYFAQGFSSARENGFFKGLPHGEEVRRMLKLAVPTGVQQFLFAAGFTTFFGIIGRVGTAEAAAANALITTMLTCVLPGLAFGIAAASLVGQSLGRGNAKDAYLWGWDVVKVAALTMQGLGVVLLLFAEPILGIFLHDPETLNLALLPLQIFGATIFFDGIGNVLMNALLGAGAATTTLAVSVFTQWGLMLPAAYLVGPVLGHGLLGIWLCLIGQRVVMAAVFGGVWMSKKWAKIEV